MDDESRRVKFYFLAVAIFLVSAWGSCREVKYAIWGRTADAKIVSVQEVSVASRRRVRDEMAVRYRWTDADDGQREDVMNRPLDWQRPADDVIRIEYLPGVKESRMAGERGYIGIALFVAMSGVMIFSVVKILHDAKR